MSFTLALAVLLAFSVGVYVLGRRRAVSRASGETLHSLPGYYGTWVALWTGVPAALILVLFLTAGPRLGEALLSADPPTFCRFVSPSAIPGS